MTTSKKTEASFELDEIRCAVAAIEDKKGESIRVLDVRGKSSVTDYLILATGMSNPHLKAMKLALDKALKDAGVTAGEIDEVVLVGGMTRMPKITEIVADFARVLCVRTCVPDGCRTTC